MPIDHPAEDGNRIPLSFHYCRTGALIVDSRVGPGFSNHDPVLLGIFIPSQRSLSLPSIRRLQDNQELLKILPSSRRVGRKVTTNSRYFPSWAWDYEYKKADILRKLGAGKVGRSVVFLCCQYLFLTEAEYIVFLWHPT
ncbi:hypothetical protein EDD18DRAFT_1330407 [Armillaria luteobubalina]|uniref:Uncharacterized protein n=1 Tax=Armillaria luteobubalina TaxID=153913 RepID=A0AA39UQC3_9AGAR|nr:hypothetical protein EDD18DRAFT_1330407 [Armillaria luteobubalina]